MSVAGGGFSRGGGRDPRPVGGRCRRKGTEELPYHVPVMAVEVVAGLLVDDDGLYIDATAGGGGVLVTPDGDYARYARYLSTQAKDDALEYVHNEIGYNYRMMNLNAALGVAE